MVVTPAFKTSTIYIYNKKILPYSKNVPKLSLVTTLKSTSG